MKSWWKQPILLGFVLAVIEIPSPLAGVKTCQPTVACFSGGRVNLQVRQLMEVITRHFGYSYKDTPTDEWGKLRSYLYRATDTDQGLSHSQTERVLFFLDELFPENKALQKTVVQSLPRILTKNVKTKLRPTAAFLKRLYGDDVFVVAVSRNPDLLLTTGTGYDSDELDLVEVFLKQELEFSQSKIDKLKESAPFIMTLSVVNLLATVNFFRGILAHQSSTRAPLAKNDTATIGNLITSHPYLFQLSVAENLKPRIKFLQERCSLEDADLATLMKSSAASILGLSVEENLKPTIDMLAGLLPQRDLRRAIILHPQLLCLSRGNLLKKIHYFDTIDFYSQRSHLRPGLSLASRVLVRSPAVFSLSLRENIVPTVEYLARIWGTNAPKIDFDELVSCSSASELSLNLGSLPSSDESRCFNSLSSLLSEYPSILTMSLKKNIQPTIDFYERAGYVTLSSGGCLLRRSDEKQTIIRGRHIAASLFNRLVPRWYFYFKTLSSGDRGEMDSVQLRLVASATPSVTPAKIPLHILAGATDKLFCDQFGFDTEDYIRFKKNSMPLLKFNMQFDRLLTTGDPFHV